MWLCVAVLLFSVVGTFGNDSSEIDIDSNLVSKLRDDANLDLTTDTEYEDMRAELLASHTVLAKLAETELLKKARRSLSNTPCWNLGGICINSNLCVGLNYLTEVPGCKDKLRVCCFVSNKYNVRDLSEYGLSNPSMPWSAQNKFGSGLGVIEIDTTVKKSKPKKKKKKKKTIMSEPLEPNLDKEDNKADDSHDEDKPVALIIRTN